MPHVPARPAPAVGAGGRPQRGVDVGPLALRALKAHRCMKRRKPRARRQRVDADVSARYAFAKLAQDPHHGVSRALYRFALEFVGLAIPPIGRTRTPSHSCTRIRLNEGGDSRSNPGDCRGPREPNTPACRREISVGQLSTTTPFQLAGQDAAGNGQRPVEAARIGRVMVRRAAEVTELLRILRGSRLGSGPRGRWFESTRPDQYWRVKSHYTGDRSSSFL